VKGRRIKKEEDEEGRYVFDRRERRDCFLVF